jgi:hypothetical protein
LAECTSPGTRILGMMTTAINTMMAATMNSIRFSPQSGRRYNNPDTPRRDCLCACAHAVWHVNSEVFCAISF